MTEDVSIYIKNAKSAMNDSIEHLQRELIKVRTGKASPAMMNDILVEYYGNPTPLNQVANVTTSDSRTLVIQPWEKSMLGAIEKAILSANLGLTPNNDGELIRINIPQLTEERRKELVKKAKSLGEEAKVSIRNARREAMESLKKAIKDGLPEDLGKRKEGEVQDITDGFNDKIDKVIEAKEKDIMAI